ncbi:MAG: hemerythrin domain-containing protein [Desulfurococcales archaeon]|nr:hemerythrin domain-containing protein [Desulfurococcales archaeon]
MAGIRRVYVPGLAASLRRHHDRILEALDLLEKMVSLDRPPLSDVKTLLDFIENYVDSCHHTIEECVLFQGANNAGFPLEGSPIQVMVCEHGIGRYLLRLLRESVRRAELGRGEGLEEVRSYAMMYASLLRAHIEKENNILFPALEASYSEVESTVDAEEIEKRANHDYWENLLEELKSKYKS